MNYKNINRMKTKVLFLLAIALMLSLSVNAQRGVRIGYIDTEYILENVPEYQEATTQLATKVQKWKAEIEKKLSEIEQQKKDLSNESVLLTDALVKEREEDILGLAKLLLNLASEKLGKTNWN